MTIWLFPSVLSQQEFFFFNLLIPFCVPLNVNEHFKILILYSYSNTLAGLEVFLLFLPNNFFFFPLNPKLIANHLFYLSYQTAHDPNEVHFSFVGLPDSISSFFTARRQFNTYDFSRSATLKLRSNHHEKDDSKSRVMVWRKLATLWGIQVSGLEKWSGCLHERGDRSIKNQLEMGWRVEGWGWGGVGIW